MQEFIVGGFVRDKLLGINAADKDWVVVGATLDQMQAANFKQVGREFPVFLHPQTQEEYALARTEKKTAAGYNGFICDFNKDITIEQDLQRRDFTINAMAMDAATGAIIDPYGGQQDLEHKLIRHVSSAFIEDPLRVLRAARFLARFYSLGFKIAPETLELMQAMVQNGEISALAKERVWREIHRALTEKSPQQFFLTLHSIGALQIIFPQLANLWGVPQRREYHPEIDTGVHTMLVLEQIVFLSNDPKVRFAALCHDLGKALTPKDQWPSHKQHEVRGELPIKEFAKTYNIPKSFSRFAVKCAKLHLLSHRALELTPSTLLKLFNDLDAFRNPEHLYEFTLVCEADARGRTGLQNRAYPQSAFMRQALQHCAKVSYAHLLAQGLQGPKLGQAIQEERLEAIVKFKQNYLSCNGTN